jgi:hypothetical protein
VSRCEQAEDALDISHGSGKHRRIQMRYAIRHRHRESHSQRHRAPGSAQVMLSHEIEPIPRFDSPELARLAPSSG